MISSIAVSGLPCSGKTTLASSIAKKLGWGYSNTGENLRQIAKARGIPIEKFGRLDEGDLRAADAMTLEGMKTRPHYVWEGRLSAWLSKDIPLVLRIFVTADFDVRSSRLCSRDKISHHVAGVRLIERQDEETKVFKSLYGISDVIQNSNPDLILDSSNLSVEEMIDSVFKSQGILFG